MGSATSQAGPDAIPRTDGYQPGDMSYSCQRLKIVPSGIRAPPNNHNGSGIDIWHGAGPPADRSIRAVGPQLELGTRVRQIEGSRKVRVVTGSQIRPRRPDRTCAKVRRRPPQHAATHNDALHCHPAGSQRTPNRRSEPLADRQRPGGENVHIDGSGAWKCASQQQARPICRQAPQSGIFAPRPALRVAKNLIRHSDQGLFVFSCADNKVGNRDQ